MEEIQTGVRLKVESTFLRTSDPNSGKDDSMKTARLTLTVLLGVMLTFTAATLSASDPIGIYALVDKVIFEPSEGAPQRVQIWGTFALADVVSRVYTKPQRGYLYYAVPVGKEEIARKEWADLKSVAGTGTAVAFGARHSMLGKVRPDSEKPGSPDVYNIGGTGVSRINPVPGYQDNMNEIVAQLKAAMKKT